MPDAEEADAPAAASTLLERTPLVALRVVQFAVDVGIVALITVLPMSVMLVLPRNPDGSLGALLLAIPVVLGLLVLSVALSWWYWSWLPRRREGRTLAMRWLGLRVVNLDGRDATGSQLTLRWLLLTVDALLFGAVGLVAMLVTTRHQRIGDAFADTLVVREVR